jgi:hypothetical protein
MGLFSLMGVWFPSSAYRTAAQEPRLSVPAPILPGVNGKSEILKKRAEMAMFFCIKGFRPPKNVSLPIEVKKCRGILPEVFILFWA